MPGTVVLQVKQISMRQKERHRRGIVLHPQPRDEDRRRDLKRHQRRGDALIETARACVQRECNGQPGGPGQPHMRFNRSAARGPRRDGQCGGRQQQRPARQAEAAHRRSSPSAVWPRLGRAISDDEITKPGGTIA